MILFGIDTKKMREEDWGALIILLSSCFSFGTWAYVILTKISANAILYCSDRVIIGSTEYLRKIKLNEAGCNTGNILTLDSFPVQIGITLAVTFVLFGSLFDWVSKKAFPHALTKNTNSVNITAKTS